MIFVIFELGPYSIRNPCAMLYHLNQSAVGLGHFFTLKIDSEVLGTKKGENSSCTVASDKRVGRDQNIVE